MNLVIHFWLKSGKVRELESQKVRESEGTLLKKLEGNPEEVSHNFSEFIVKSLFCKSKLTNLKNSGGVGGGGGGSEIQKSICILKPFWSFSGIAHT